MRRRLPLPPPKACIQCGAEFQPTAKYPQQRFCGHRCQWLAQKGPAYNADIARSSVEKRGDAQRGSTKNETRRYPYRKMMQRHEHRVIAERKLGRPLHDGEVVRILDRSKPITIKNVEVYPSRSAFAAVIFSRKHSQEHHRKVWETRRKNLHRRKSA